MASWALPKATYGMNSSARKYKGKREEEEKEEDDNTSEEAGNIHGAIKHGHGLVCYHH